jgi:murein tripeptide amidase MpaA
VDVRAILESPDIFVVAAVNPDGKAYSQLVDPGGSQNFWWRKNRRKAGMPAGAVGVDVNRNFAFLWPGGIGTESDATQFTTMDPRRSPSRRRATWAGCSTPMARSTTSSTYTVSGN